MLRYQKRRSDIDTLPIWLTDTVRTTLDTAAITEH